MSTYIQLTVIVDFVPLIRSDVVLPYRCTLGQFMDLYIPFSPYGFDYTWYTNADSKLYSRENHLGLIINSPRLKSIKFYITPDPVRKELCEDIRECVPIIREMLRPIPGGFNFLQAQERFFSSTQ